MIPNLVHLDDVPDERQDAAAGWSISQFRLPITGRNGSSSTVFHGRFLPGSQHTAHRHDSSDEMCVYLRGGGLVGAGDDRLTVGPGFARLVPRGVDHFFHNATVGEPAEVIGIYIGAGDVADSGYVFRGDLSDEELRRCERDSSRSTRYPVVDAAAVPSHAAAAIGWKLSDCRQLLATTTEPPACCFAVTVSPGGSHARRRITNAETIYYVHPGGGDRGCGARDRPVATRPCVVRPAWP